MTTHLTPEQRSAIARKGGLAFKAKYGNDAFRKLGRRGGLIHYLRHGPEPKRQRALETFAKKDASQ